MHDVQLVKLIRRVRGDALATAVDLEEHDLCCIAAVADADHRTVDRFLRNQETQRLSRARLRIARAMLLLGLGAHLTPTWKRAAELRAPTRSPSGKRVDRRGGEKR